MWQGLTVEKVIGHRTHGIPLHPGCSTFINGVKLMRQGEHALGVYSRFTIDRECATWLSERLKGHSNRFNLLLHFNEAPHAIRYLLNNQLVETPAQHYLLSNPMDMTRTQPNQALEGFEIILTQEFLRDCRDMIGIPKSMGSFDFDPQPRPKTPLEHPLTQFKDLFHRSLVTPREWDVWAPMAMVTALMSLMETLWTHHPSGLRRRLEELGYQKELDPRLFKAVDYLGAHFAQPINNPALAKASGVSESGLHRLFKEQLHTTPHEYLRKLRVQKAKEWLAKAPKQDWQAAAEHVGLGSAWALKKAVHAMNQKQPARP